MSGSFWQRLVRGTVRRQARADWDAFAGTDWPTTIMSTAVTDRFHAKQGRSTGRLIMHAAGRPLSVYLKRHYRLPWWQGWLASLYPGGNWSPALQEWAHLEWAQVHGFPVPGPVAAAEFIGPAGRLQSCLAVEELVGMLPLHEAIPAAATALDAPTFRRWKTGIALEVARLSWELHRRRRFHKDLYLCHFYIPGADVSRIPLWRGRVHLIDLHRLGHHPWTGPIWQIKDLAQLLYSSEIAGVTARDRLTFWKRYLGPQRRRWPGRLLRSCVLGKWQRYRRHNRPEASAAVPPQPGQATRGAPPKSAA